MPTITPRDRRLVAELNNMRRLEKDSPYVRFKATPEDCPEEYEVTYSCLGLIAQPEDPQWGRGGLPPTWRRSHPKWVGNRHIAHIELTADYPASPPRVRFVTPVFHPNLKHLTEDELERILGERFGSARVKHVLKTDPELREKTRKFLATYICLDGITPPGEGGAYAPRVTLYDICRELGQMIMLQRYNLRDPLDLKAAEWTRWAEKQENLLPIDSREFLGNLEPAITVVGTQGSSGGDPEEAVEITVLPGEEA